MAALAAHAGLAGATPISAQSLTGPTGLVTVPTAGMPADGALAVGVNVVDTRFHNFGSDEREGRPALVQYASVGFLPFVEIGLRLTRIAGVPRQALGDRFVSVRVRLLREGRRAPAVVAGVHDLVGTRVFHAEYVVVSKTFQATPLGEVGVHLGYGGDWLSLHAIAREFQGPFGGMSVAPWGWVVLLAEHDTERLNAGVRLRAGRLSLLAALQGLEAPAGGITYTHLLK